MIAVAVALAAIITPPYTPATRIDLEHLAAESVTYIVPTPGDCSSYHDLAIDAGWSEQQWPQVERYMWRESHCLPWARSRTRDTGLLQVNDIVTRDTSIALRVGHTFTAGDLTEPGFNLRVGRALCQWGIQHHRGCWWAWR